MKSISLLFGQTKLQETYLSGSTLNHESIENQCKVRSRSIWCGHSYRSVCCPALCPCYVNTLITVVLQIAFQFIYVSLSCINYRPYNILPSCLYYKTTPSCKVWRINLKF